MKKGVAIPYIIALIIGVIVVAVLAYWLISTGGKGNKFGDDALCTSRKTEYCTTQNSDTLSKVTESCSSVPIWCDYCKFIPNWKPLSGPPCPSK